MPDTVTLLAGVPDTNRTLFHQIRFAVGDAAAYLGNLPPEGKSLLIIRDLEMQRARAHAQADQVACPADFSPAGGLSGDRDVATAQAVVELLTQRGVKQVKTDRSLPFLFAAKLLQAGIEVNLDDDLGVKSRRVKSADEIAALEHAQQITGQVMTKACRWIATADVDSQGQLLQEGQILTSERVRRQITSWLIDLGFANPHDSIVASLPHVADCHHKGTGPIRTGCPVVVDIFPLDTESHYNGDCTRTVVHGTASEEFIRMHAAVQAAKQAAIDALKPGTTGDAVHQATVASLAEHGYRYVPASEERELETPVMNHGTGHGIGLDVHEPILLSTDGEEILAGEVFTVEPGLYSSVHGGVRIEDMVHVTADGPVTLSPLYEGYDWLEVE
ncbi:M24 family metallopeptidase [Aeoliella mucimassa]|uniref:Xaa-Pro aminopeptidase 1 n=1 Tax=Aeoliella mucimassa TaxID=2527972 RepID=A0A518AVC1_9BACT|nr:Xaa-Pro peptidase family protein [Aeoliella mucimassa]QDU58674.1 Xaa-Pro aminopeptidase 1 [Aeoliella mucimassa]